MKDLPIGTVVGIRKDSEYYGRDERTNPAERSGVVVNIGAGNGLKYCVKWDHSGSHNSYRRTDLKYWKGPRTWGDEAEVVENKEPVDLQVTIEKAIKEMDALSHDCTARYAFLHRNGRVHVATNTACHATVMGYAEYATTEGILTSIKCRDLWKNKGNIPANKLYYNWLFNESPWADAFVWKDVEYCVDRGYVLCSTTCPGNILQGGLIASRSPWEYKKVITDMHKYVSKGVDKTQAYLLACFFNVDSDSGNVVSNANAGGHFPICCFSMKKGGLSAFLDNKALMANKPFKEASRQASDVHKTFIGGGAPAERIFRTLLRKAGSTKGTLDTNPFAKAKKTPDVHSVLLDKLCAYVKEHGLL